MKSFIRSVHHFFIPREHNNFRAKALHIHMLSSYMLFFLALGFFVQLLHTNQITQNVLGYATDITIDKLFAMTNDQRNENGLAPLTYNDKLATAAGKKANDMFANNYWAHYGPDGTTPWSFILGAGYKYEYAGENLAKNFMFSDGVIDAWMKSPTHRENMLRKEYTEVGFAIQNGVLNGEETTLVVQMFGAPLGGIPQVQAAEPSLQPAANPAAENVKAESVQKAAGQEAQPLQARPTIPATLPGDAQMAAQQPGNATGPSWMKIFYNTNLLFIGFLILAFILDFVVAIKLNVLHLRVGGKTIAHVLFLLFALVGLIIIAKGTIL